MDESKAWPTGQQYLDFQVAYWTYQSNRLKKRPKKPTKGSEHE